ncbi:MAG: WD40 repeat domain-containing protein [Polyangiaceae bacterium]
MAVRTNADGSRAVAGDSKGTVVAIDVRAHRVLCKYGAGAVPVTALAMTDDGTRFAIADEAGNIVTLRSDDCGKLSIANAAGAISRMLFVPNTSDLLNAAGSALELRREGGPTVTHTFRGHDAAITSIGVSRDGKLAATGASDGTVVVWRLAKVDVSQP